MAAIDLADRLDADAILRMQDALLRETSPHLVGWRVLSRYGSGRTAAPPDSADFVAPHHSRIEPAIDDLVSFCARDDLPVLTQAAVAHAQFETIHPFADGNGRTGRALVHALLRARASRATSRSPSPEGCRTTATATSRPSTPTARVTPSRSSRPSRSRASGRSSTVAPMRQRID